MAVLLFLLSVVTILFVVLRLIRPGQAGLLVESNVDALIYIDGQEVGRPPYDVILPPKEVLVLIKPVDKRFGNYETKLKLIEGVKTIIKKDFAEVDSLSSSATLSFEKIISGRSEVSLISYPDGASIFIDGRFVGYAPIKIQVEPGNHQLSILHPGYMEKSLPIVVYKGYNLTLRAKLSQIDQKQTNKIFPIGTKVQLSSTLENVYAEPGTSSAIIAEIDQDTVMEVVEDGGNWVQVEFDIPGDQSSLNRGWVDKSKLTEIVL